jgi:dethiobiotin synthetase
VSAIFITATGTDIGKTFVAGGLIRELRQRGRAVDAIKPVLSGFDPARAAESDAGRLLTALGRPATMEEIDRVTPFRFAAPMSPDMAARAEGRMLDYADLVAFCRRAMVQARGTLVIEGVGGVMVPLDRAHTVLDWISVLRTPLVLVCGSYLGTLSHTLTALHVVAQRGLDIAAVVVSETAGSTVPLADTAASIADFAQPIPVLALPRLPDGAAHAAFAQLAALIA